MHEIVCLSKRVVTFSNISEWSSCFKRNTWLIVLNETLEEWPYYTGVENRTYNYIRDGTMAPFALHVTHWLSFKISMASLLFSSLLFSSLLLLFSLSLPYTGVLSVTWSPLLLSTSVSDHLLTHQCTPQSRHYPPHGAFRNPFPAVWTISSPDLTKTKYIKI